MLIQESQKLSFISKSILITASICLFVSIFVPLWRIELMAPQYPEGLVLQIFTNKLGGQVEIINGLNHYIGMKTLHKEDFVEFTILPYIIGFFALTAFLVAIKGNKKGLYLFLGSFVFFGIVAMVDFYRWNYNYGHNLDPNAAIIVPGMAYQPPLIGFKQLLNFGAYSIPDVGGWLFVVSGLLLLVAVLMERKIIKLPVKNANLLLISMVVLFWSCGNEVVPQIKLNTDHCDFCRMTISEARFSAALVTKKGRVYRFDDVSCMVKYKNENVDKVVRHFYISDFEAENKLISVDKAFLIQSEQIVSPMLGNVAAFSNHKSAQEYLVKLGAVAVDWAKLNF